MADLHSRSGRFHPGLAAVVSELALFSAVALITFASRAAFMVKPRTVRSDSGPVAVFPLALFVGLATIGAVAPEGSLELEWPLVTSVVVAALIAATRRVGLLAVMACGYSLFWGWTWLN